MSQNEHILGPIKYWTLIWQKICQCLQNDNNFPYYHYEMCHMVFDIPKQFLSLFTKRQQFCILPQLSLPYYTNDAAQLTEMLN